MFRFSPHEKPRLMRDIGTKLFAYDAHPGTWILVFQIFDNIFRHQYDVFFFQLVESFPQKAHDLKFQLSIHIGHFYHDSLMRILPQ